MSIRNSIDWLKAKAALLQIGMGSMAAAAEFMAARAVDYAPVDTGFMAYHIQVFVRNNDVKAQVISTAYYSQWVEFGHMTIAGNFVPPHPFMRPALADTIREFPEIVRHYATTRPLENGGSDPHLTTNVSFLSM